jgi:hypothetical protein
MTTESDRITPLLAGMEGLRQTRRNKRICAICECHRAIRWSMGARR